MIELTAVSGLVELVTILGTGWGTSFRMVNCWCRSLGSTTSLLVNGQMPETPSGFSITSGANIPSQLSMTLLLKPSDVLSIQIDGLPTDIKFSVTRASETIA